MAILHEREKVVENRRAVARPRRGLRMELNAQNRQGRVAESFDRAVIDVHVRNGDIVGEAWLERVIVVLGRDRAPARDEVFHGMVAAVVPERKLVGLAAEREAEKLVSQTDPEDRTSPDQGADRVEACRDIARIPGAVREYDAVGRARENLFGRRERREDRERATAGRERSQDRFLDAEVEDREALSFSGDEARFRHGHFGHEIPTDRFRRRESFHENGRVAAFGRYDAEHASPNAKVTRQRARIDPADAHDAVFAEVVRGAYRAPPVSRAVAELLDHEASTRGRDDSTSSSLKP